MKERFTDAFYYPDSTVQEKIEKIRRLEHFAIEVSNERTALIVAAEESADKYEIQAQLAYDMEVGLFDRITELEQKLSQANMIIETKTEQLKSCGQQLYYMERDIKTNDILIAREKTDLNSAYKTIQEQTVVIKAAEDNIRRLENIVAEQEKSIKTQARRIRGMKARYEDSIDFARDRVRDLEDELSKKLQMRSFVQEMMEPVPVVPQLSEPFASKQRAMNSWCDP